MPKFKNTVKLNKRNRQRRITRLMARDGNSCHICNKIVDRKIKDHNSDEYVTFDHILPQSKGGTDEDSNVKLAHAKCNRNRGNAND